MEDKLMTIKEVAAYLRLSKAQVYAMIQKRQLPHIRMGEKRLVVKESELKKWVENKSVQVKGDVWYTPGW